MSDATPPPSWRNFHGRRHGKTLRPTQRRHVDELLPRLAVPGVDPLEHPVRKELDLDALFGGSREVWLEVGTGGGEHIADRALAHPEFGLIGCEPYINGVAMLLGRIERMGIGNIRIHPGDARDLIDLLPDGALGRVYVLYPDPWPKSRHHKRRFICPENLTALARVMAPGSELRLATDIAEYVEHSLEAVGAVDDFSTAASAADWHEPWEGWKSTRYEAKALREGRPPHYLIFKRR